MGILSLEILPHFRLLVMPLSRLILFTEQTVYLHKKAQIKHCTSLELNPAASMKPGNHADLSKMEFSLPRPWRNMGSTLPLVERKVECGTSAGHF